MLNDCFNKNAEFCPTHLIHERYFNGGGSWSPDTCPICRTNDFILWKQMNIFQKLKAKHLFNEMWKEQYGCDYFKEN